MNITLQEISLVALCFAISLYSYSFYSGFYTTQWDFGTDFKDQIQNMITTTEKEGLVISWLTEKDLSSKNAGHTELYVAKLKAKDLSPIWVVQYESPQKKFWAGGNNGLIETPDGHVIACGWTEGSPGLQKPLVVKLDGSSGKTLWIQEGETAGLWGQGSCAGIEVDSSTGRILVVGTSRESWKRTLEGQSDIVLAAMDGDDGHLVWGIQQGSGADDEGNSVAIDQSSGSIYIGGFVRTKSEEETGLSEDHQIFCSKFSPKGEEVWQVVSNKVSTSSVIKVLAADNAVFIVGKTFGDLLGVNGGTEDPFVMRLDGETGTVGWAQQLAGSQRELVTSAVLTRLAPGYPVSLLMVVNRMDDEEENQRSTIVLNFDVVSGAVVEAYQGLTISKDSSLIVSALIDETGKFYYCGHSFPNVRNKNQKNSEVSGQQAVFVAGSPRLPDKTEDERAWFPMVPERSLSLGDRLVRAGVVRHSVLPETCVLPEEGDLAQLSPCMLIQKAEKSSEVSGILEEERLAQLNSLSESEIVLDVQLTVEPGIDCVEDGAFTTFFLNITNEAGYDSTKIVKLTDSVFGSLQYLPNQPSSGARQACYVIIGDAFDLIGDTMICQYAGTVELIDGVFYHDITVKAQKTQSGDKDTEFHSASEVLFACSTESPTASPTRTPTDLPTETPTASPTRTPTDLPTKTPTASPTRTPTDLPTKTPTALPTRTPTDLPTKAPTAAPTHNPTVLPTTTPTNLPTASPTMTPTTLPTASPTETPSTPPSLGPTFFPTFRPTLSPTMAPTASPSEVPTPNPSLFPSSNPSLIPSSSPSLMPSFEPSISPSLLPSFVPSLFPTEGPTAEPTSEPSSFPTSNPTDIPTMFPTASPTGLPTAEPSPFPTFNPTVIPTLFPTAIPTAQRSEAPTDHKVYEGALSHAQFSNIGTKIIIHFAFDVDQGESAGLSGVFDCNLLFEMDSSSKECLWVAAHEVEMVMDGEATLLPGDTIVLLANQLKRLSDGAYAVADSVTVLPPEIPLLPEILVSAPSTIGLCDDMEIDVSGSTGTGGRELFIEYRIMAAPTNSDALLDFVLALNESEEVITLPNKYLQPGEDYLINVTATNFFGGFNWHEVEFTISAFSVPSVSILGGLHQSVYVFQGVKIEAEAVATTCSNSTSSQLEYEWQVYDSDGDLLQLFSSSSNPKYMLLPAYSLTAGEEYIFTVSVTDLNGLSNSAQMELYVQRQNVVAKILGGSRTISAEDELFLDGTESYDPDASDGSIVDASYSWQCAVQNSTLTPDVWDCGSIVEEALSSLTATDATLTIPSFSLQSNVSYVFTLHVTTQWSSASTFAVVTVTAGAVPAVLITTSLPTKVNPDEKVILEAQVGGVDDASVLVSYQWLLDDTDGLTTQFSAAESLSEATLTEVSGSFASRITRIVYMVIGSDELVSDGHYVFKISANYQGQSNAAISQVDVVVNGPPSSGHMIVDPVTGLALVDDFSLTTHSWEDDTEDLPMDYEFFYVHSVSGAFSLLQDKARSNKASALLPVGYGVNGTGYVGVRAYDVHGAYGEETTVVYSKAYETTVAELTDIAEVLFSEAEESYNGAMMLQVASAASSMLMETNCTLAPHCASLYREECGSGDDHTCGLCWDGYSGSTTSMNTACHADGADCSNGVKDVGETDIDCGGDCAPCQAGMSCSIDADCESDFCDDGICSELALACPNNCNSRGTCIFKDANGNELESCTAADIFCETSCNCTTGWYGDDCRLTSTQAQERAQLTDTLISGIATAIELTTIDEKTAEQIFEVTTQSLESSKDVIEDSTLINGLMIQHEILETMISDGTGLSIAGASSLLDSLSLALDSDIEANQTFINDLASEAVGDIQEIFLEGLVEGEEPAQLQSDGLKLSMARVSTAAESSVSLPLGELEQSAGRTAPGVSLGEGVANFGESTTVALSEWATSPHPSSNENLTVVGPTVSIKLTADESGEGSDTIWFLVQMNSYQDIEEQPVEEHFVQGFCPTDMIGERSLFCGDQEVVYQCDGAEREVNVTCSTGGSLFQCVVFNEFLGDWDADACELVGYEGPHATCNCTFGVQSEFRRLLGDGESKSEKLAGGDVAASMNVIGGEISATFGESITMFNNPAVLGESWAVFLLLGFFLFVIPVLAVISPILVRNWKRRNQMKVLFDKMAYDEKASHFYAEDQAALLLRTVIGKPKNVLTRLVYEHDWLSLFAPADEKWTQLRKCARLIADVLTVMFWDATLYGIYYPQDPACATKGLKDDCVMDTNGDGTGEYLCTWQEEEKACTFMEPEHSFSEAMYISMLVILLTVPLLLLVHFVMKCLIMLPTSAKEEAAFPDDDDDRDSDTETERSFTTGAPKDDEGSRKRASVQGALAVKNIYGQKRWEPKEVSGVTDIPDKVRRKQKKSKRSSTVSNRVVDKDDADVNRITGGMFPERDPPAKETRDSQRQSLADYLDESMAKRNSEETRRQSLAEYLDESMAKINSATQMQAGSSPKQSLSDSERRESVEDSNGEFRKRTSSREFDEFETSNDSDESLEGMQEALVPVHEEQVADPFEMGLEQSSRIDRNKRGSMLEYFKTKPKQVPKGKVGQEHLANVSQVASETHHKYLAERAQKTPHLADFLEGRKDMSTPMQTLSPVSFITTNLQEANFKEDITELEKYLDQKVQSMGVKGAFEMKQSPRDDDLDMGQFVSREASESKGKDDAEKQEQQQQLKRSLSMRRRMAALNLGAKFDGGGEVSKMVDEEMKLHYKSKKGKPFYKRVAHYLCYFCQDPLKEEYTIAEIQKHVMLSIYLQESLQTMSLAEQNVILLGAAQMDYLSFTERRILERIHDNEEEEDVTKRKAYPQWMPTLGWCILNGYILLISYYIILFGVRFGEKTVNMWLSSFFLGFFHDAILFLPLKVYIVYKALPWVLTGKLELNRIKKLPTYCASLQVARRMPELTASKILLEHKIPRGNLAKFFSHSRSKFVELLHVLAILLLTFLVIFPYELQDMLIETSVNAIYSETLLTTIRVMEQSLVGAVFLIIFILGTVVALFLRSFAKKAKKKKEWKDKVHGKRHSHMSKTQPASSLGSPISSPDSILESPRANGNFNFTLPQDRQPVRLPSPQRRQNSQALSKGFVCRDEANFPEKSGVREEEEAAGVDTIALPSKREVARGNSKVLVSPSETRPTSPTFTSSQRRRQSKRSNITGRPERDIQGTHSQRSSIARRQIDLQNTPSPRSMSSPQSNASSPRRYEDYSGQSQI